MPTILKTKNSVITTVAPTTLQQGELAVNITDKKMWVGNAATTPVQLFGAGADGSFVNLAYTGTLTGGTGIVNLGSGQFYKDATGKVGIGNSTPSTTLVVSATGAGTKGGEVFIVNSSTRQVGNFAQLGFAPNADYGSGTTSGAFIRGLDTTGSATNSTDLVFGAGSGGTPTERMRINSSGNVGIGTGSPTTRLDVLGSGNTVINSTGNLFVSDGGTAAQAANEGGQISLGAWLNGDLSTPYPMAIIKGITESSTTNTNSGALLFGTAASSATVSERMRITSDGNVGIGTTAPLSKLDITSSNGTDPNADGASFLRLTNTASGVNSTSGVGFYASLSGTQFQTAYIQSVATFNANADSMLAFGTRSTSGAATERMRILSTGNILSLAGGSTTATGTGIAFPATQNASTFANVLDDYEEGTFTPTISTTGTAFSNSQDGSGWYTKIGNVVTIWGGVNLNGVTSGGTGNVRLSSLPFTVRSGVAAQGVWMPGRVTVTATLGYAVVALGATTQASINYVVSGANPTELPASAFNGNTTPYFSFTMTYQTT